MIKQPLAKQKRNKKAYKTLYFAGADLLICGLSILSVVYVVRLRGLGFYRKSIFKCSGVCTNQSLVKLCPNGKIKET